MKNEKITLTTTNSQKEYDVNLQVLLEILSLMENKENFFISISTSETDFSIEITFNGKHIFAEINNKMFKIL